MAVVVAVVRGEVEAEESVESVESVESESVDVGRYASTSMQVTFIL